jgi:hypothetical protein
MPGRFPQHRQENSHGDPVVVHIVPSSETDERRIFYNAFIYNEFLLGPTVTPYTDTARELLARGYDGERQLLMRRKGVDVNQLQYTIEHAAELEIENQANPPFFWPLQQDGPGAVP